MYNHTQHGSNGSQYVNVGDATRVCLCIAIAAEVTIACPSCQSLSPSVSHLSAVAWPRCIRITTVNQSSS